MLQLPSPENNPTQIELVLIIEYRYKKKIFFMHN